MNSEPNVSPIMSGFWRFHSDTPKEIVVAVAEELVSGLDKDRYIFLQVSSGPTNKNTTEMTSVIGFTYQLKEPTKKAYDKQLHKMRQIICKHVGHTVTWCVFPETEVIRHMKTAA